MGRSEKGIGNGEEENIQPRGGKRDGRETAESLPGFKKMRRLSVCGYAL